MKTVVCELVVSMNPGAAADPPTDRAIDAGRKLRIEVDHAKRWAGRGLVRIVEGAEADPPADSPPAADRETDVETATADDAPERTAARTRRRR